MLNMRKWVEKDNFFDDIYFKIVGICIDQNKITKKLHMYIHTKEAKNCNNLNMMFILGGHNIRPILLYN